MLMNDVTTRIADICDRLYKGKVQTFAKACNIATPTLRDIIKNNANPRLQTLMLILDGIPTLSAEWLLRGEGPMFRGLASSGTVNNFDISKNKAVGDHNTVGDAPSVTPDILTRLLDQNTQLIQAITELKK